jgi:HAD superfamily hydrolase (TIGR01509 family)
VCAAVGYFGVGNIVKHRIRAILFDLGGVLIRPRRDYLPDPRLDRFEALICTHLDEDTARGKVLLELGFGREAFTCALVRLAEKYERDEILWRVLESARSSLKTAILNNGSAVALPVFEDKFRVLSSVDLFLNSAIEGVAKPDARFFQLACERLNLRAEECLCIDDIEANVQAAARLGMRMILWNGSSAGYSQIAQAIGATGFEPNKALEPTPGTVTPRADARVAPAPGVAHV